VAVGIDTGDRLTARRLQDDVVGEERQVGIRVLTKPGVPAPFEEGDRFVALHQRCQPMGLSMTASHATNTASTTAITAGLRPAE
jgi:hypothetical protein